MKLLHVDLYRWLGMAGLTFCLAPPVSVAGEAGYAVVSSTGGASCSAPDASSELAFSIELSYQEWVNAGGESTRTASLDTSDDDLDHDNCTYSLSVTETADDASVFDVSITSGMTIDPSDSTSVTLSVSADTTELAGLPATETFTGDYELTLTGVPK